MNSKTRLFNSLRNIFFGVGNQIFILILNFVQRTIFINLLGPEYLGINGLFGNILSLLCLADLGLGTAMVYSFYQPIAEKDTKKIAALVTYYRKIYMGIAGFIFVVGMLLLPFIQYMVNLENEMPYLHLYYFLFLLNTVVSYLFVYKTCIVNADQNNYLISIYSVVFNVIKIVGQIICLLLTHNFTLYLVIMVACTFLNNYFSARKAQKLYPFINKKENLPEVEKKSIFQNIKSMFIYKMSGELLNSTDNIIISVLSGTVWVGFYSNYLMLVNAICNFVSIIFSSLNGSIGNLIASEGKGKKEKVFYALGFVGFWLGGFTVCCFFTLLKDFVTLWIGADCVLDTGVVIAMLLNYYLTCILNPLWGFRSATGLFNKTKFVMLFTAAVNLVVSIVLGKIFGLMGVLLGSAIARLTTYCWYEPWVLFRNFFESKVSRYFIKNIVYFIVVVGSAWITSLSVLWIDGSTWLGLFGKLGICLVVPNIIYLALFWKTEEFQYLYSVFFKKVLDKVLKRQRME